jgi:hypothetical protein
VLVGITPIHYNFSGFLKLIHDAPTFNSVNAGSSVPLRFSLAGNQGLGIFLAGYPRSQQIACDSALPLGSSEPTVSAIGLQYSPTIDQYNYVWKTNPAWTGTCRQLVVIFKDGAVHYANVWFK